jgi:phospholipid-binding lipoprotein MlaA
MGLIYSAGLVASLVLLSACSSTPQQVEPQVSDAQDPWQQLNRKTHVFNTVLDEKLLVPVVNVYKDVAPDPVEKGVTNFFSNLSDVGNMLNHGLQFKPLQVGKDLSRLVINTTLGLGGLIDVASDLGIYQQPEDFGQTLGYWGVKPGPYLVLPFLGPSTLRDAGATLIDAGSSPINQYDPVVHQFVIYGFLVIDHRRQLGDLETLISGDPYVFIREAYLQRREYLISDGVPSEDDEFDDF